MLSHYASLKPEPHQYAHKLASSCSFCAAAAGNGVIFPCFSLLFGALLADFNSPSIATNFTSTIDTYSLYFLLIAIGAALATFLEIALPLVAAERQIKRVREAYLHSLLRQDQEYYDSNKAGELASRLTEDTLTMTGGIGDKITSTVHYSITFLAGLAIGFARSWELTLVIFATIPLIVVVMGFLRMATVGYEAAIAKAYAKAGDAANETFSNIRTVLAYGGVEAEIERYDSHLEAAQKSGEGKGWWMGAAGKAKGIGCAGG